MLPPSRASLLRAHWFWPVAAVAFLASWNLSATLDWSREARLGEAAMLIDWCLFLPFLYALSLRGAPPKVVAIRTLAIACSGLWVAKLLVPDASEALIARWDWLRWIGMAGLTAVELAVGVALFKLVLGDRADARALERAGAPPLLAKLLLLEARFWRWVWSRLRGR
ncbi:MAG TPA: hypothetical protein VF636_06945 [Sphingomonas sp.]|jgi:hypothetical protein